MLARALAVLLLVSAAPALAKPPAKHKQKPKPAAAAKPSLPAITLTIFHTNDIHGWILARPDEYVDPATHRLIGGAAAFSSFVKTENGPKLVLDAGDWFQGTPEGNVTKGRALVDAFNAVGYDAVEIGNHDFDFGEDNLKELVSTLKMPVLGANVYESGGRRKPAWLKSWIIKEVGGVKVGVFGLLTTNMRNLTFEANYKGLEFRREIDEARSAVKLLRDAGATVVIAVTHVGFEQKDLGRFEGDQTIAREVPGLDLIVGGHSHTFLREPYRDPVNGTLVVQAGTTLSVGGRVRLEIDPETKKVVSSTAALVDLWVGTFGEDPDVVSALKKDVAAVGSAYDVPVATSAARLSRNRDGESLLGDWITDCERDWARADIAIQNGGGIRADMPEGAVTLRRIFSIMPFDNRMVTLKMDGKLVGEMLDHGVDRSKAMFQVAGATFSYDRDKPNGQRLEDVRVGGKPLAPAKTYKVVASDFIVRGGDGFSVFDRAEAKDFSTTLERDVLDACAKRQRVIAVPQSPRMRPEAKSGTQESPR